MRPALRMLLLLNLFAMTGCDREERTGPPVLRLGRDECAECGMTIHDERSAVAVLSDRDGRRNYQLFDDIGCLLDHERSESAERRVVNRFVHDRAGGAWVVASDAFYLATDGSALRTPMGSGIAAYADRVGAQDGQREFGGEVLDFDSLVVWRRARMEERRDASGG